MSLFLNWTSLKASKESQILDRNCYESFADDVAGELESTADWWRVQRGDLRLTRVREIPLAGKALGFGDLGKGHLFGNHVTSLDCSLPLFPRQS